MQLTQHFTLAEFTAAQLRASTGCTAQRAENWLPHITHACAILLRDGCDLLDVLGRRLHVST